MDPLDPTHGADPLSAPAFEHHLYDEQHNRFPFTTSNTWPLLDSANLDMSNPQQHAAASSSSMPGDSSVADEQHASTAAGQRALTIATSNTHSLAHMAFDYAHAMQIASQQAAWQFQMPHAAQQSFAQNGNIQTSYAGSFGQTLQTSPIDFMGATTQAQFNGGIPLDAATYWPMSTAMDPPSMHPMAFPNMDAFDPQQHFNHGFPISTTEVAASSLAPSSIAGHSSPGEQWSDYNSNCGRSDNGWVSVNLSRSQDSFVFSDIPNNGVVSPQALHIRTDSSSSEQSDAPLSARSFGSYDEIFPMTSPEPESSGESKQLELAPRVPSGSNYRAGMPIHSPTINTSFSQGVAIAPSSSTSPASSGPTSPSANRRRRSPTGVSSKAIVKKKPAAPVKAEKSPTERRVGRRKGPLKPEQRQQAHEIRKVGACLRCKYLKKTCDKGEPCGGCQPSHHRLWQVPCTRVDIKELGGFFKDWTADYQRHVTMEFSIANIKGFGQTERRLMINHGYGFEFPIMARQVFVYDDKCFSVDWVETIHPNPTAFDVSTAQLSAGMGGVSNGVLSEYLEKYIAFGFEKFVDEYFEGTPFLTEILKTAHRYYRKTNLPVIHKALKLVVAYCLTQHVTMVKGLGESEMEIGRINDAQSRWYGATCAPVMLNFEIKKGLAEVWRELMKSILEELSTLYSSVYSGEKLRHWPTIFMVASLLLAVWELMQFDCHYRVPDEAVVNKFCNDMESTPVGVIVGLFQAISTKLPSFSEWDTRKHAQMLNSNPAVCDALTEVRQSVTKYETYLKQRNEAKFDRSDFDCLSNKFLSKLVIRAGAS